MELLRLEHKKLWHRKSVQIGVLLCFLYIIIFGNLLSYQWFTFGSTDDFTSSFGNHFDGYLYSRMITLIEPEPFIYMVSGIVLVIGIIVGMIGSASAVRKYLKV